MVKGADWRETRSSRGPPCLPQTSLQGPGDPSAVWAAVAGDSSEGWTGWGEGQVKDFKRHIRLKRSRGVGRRSGCCFHFFLPPDPLFFPSARLENPQEEESRWEAGLLCCPILSWCLLLPILA